MSRETKKERPKTTGAKKNRPSMLITCPAAFFFQDITNVIYVQGPLVLVPVALVVPLALLVLVLVQELVPGPPLLSWQAQAVSFLALMGSLLM